MKKRCISLFLVLSLMASLIAALPVSVSAYEGTYSSGVLYYDISNGEVTITDCTSEASGAIEIPANLGGYPVTSIGNGAFYYCSKLTSVTIPDSVTSIGNSAFDDCSSLTSVNIPNSATYIGGWAFYGCSSLTSVTIPDSITSIVSGVFLGCSSLTSITIPDSVTSIGNSAFEGCSSLQSINIPDSVTSIGYEAFLGCSSLTSITIPNSVTSIGSGVFRDCSSLTSITIPDSVTSINYWAFKYCSSLTSITIPNSVTSIGDGAFEECSSLTSITIPDSVTSIGNSAFEGCSSLQSINIPDSVTSIGYEAFLGCSSLTNILIPSSVISVGQSAFLSCKNLVNISVAEDNLNYSSVDGVLFNKDGSRLIIYPPNKPNDTYLIPNTVTYINSYAFASCNNLIYIEIPRGIKSLGGNAFDTCGNLETVFFNAVSCSGGDYYSPTTGNIHTYVFENCPKLNITFGEGITHIPDYIGATDANIPDTVQYIGKYAFSGLSISKVSLPEGLLTISDYAFANCKNLITVDMPSTVTMIGEYAFSGCSSLTEITIPQNAKYVERGAFNLCTSLKTVILQAENAEFGRYWYANTANYYYDTVFYKCDLLTNVSIGSNVKTIPSYFLYKCSKIQNVIMPNGVTSIGSNAFNGCTKLSNVYIPESVTKIFYNAFYNCSSLTGINIPNSITSIEASVFEGCSSLQSINIPDNITDIKQYTFEDCVALTNIIIPQSVTVIKDSAFKNCKSLKDIYYSGDKKLWNNIKIGNNNSDLENATIHYNSSTIPVPLTYSPPQNIIGGLNFASGNGSVNFNYSDLYFRRSSYTYNHDLSKASIRLALSAFANHESGNKYGNQHKNIKDFLEKLNFINFEKNEWYDKEPSQNSIGVAIAEKGVAMPNADYTAYDDNCTILAVAIRGGGYESEWGGNFNVGSGETHAGFALARDQVLQFIKDYVEKHNVRGKVKVWITGYSRAAATANLVGAYLDTHPLILNASDAAPADIITLSPENIYTYCFEAPAPTSDAERNDEKYSNIFSIVNQHDFVPMVVMNKWNYGRYGITKFLPSPQTNSDYADFISSVRNKFKDYSGENYIVDNFAYYYPVTSLITDIDKGLFFGQGVFLDRTMDKLADGVKSPQNYEAEYQEAFEYIGTEIVGKGKGKLFLDKLVDEFYKNKVLLVVEGATTGGISGVITRLNPRYWRCGAYKYDLMYITARKCVKNVFKELDIAVSNSAIDALTDVISEVGFEGVYTFYENIDSIEQGHFPELCMAWLDTIDEGDFTDKRLRTLYVNCPVDLEVYNSNNEKVAAVYDNVPQCTDGFYISVLIDENGQKIVYLPSDDEYSIKIIATDDGNVSYSMQEKDEAAGTVKVTNYSNIAVKKDDVLTGTAENLTAGEISYPLIGNSGELFEAEVIEDAVQLNIELSIEGNGNAYIDSAPYKGEFVNAIAEPTENEEFIGWYNGDTLLSTEASYRFEAVDNMELTAKFTDKTCEITFMDGEDIIGSVRALKGTSMPYFKAPAKCGYKFEGYYLENGDAVDENAVFEEDTILYAEYTEPQRLDGYYCYLSDDGSVEFAGFENENDSLLMLPVDISGQDVTAISDYAFANLEHVSTVLIPDTVKRIGEYAFESSSVTEVIYTGSKEDWKKIEIAENNNALEKVEIIFDYSENIVSGALEQLDYSGFALTGVIEFDYVYKDCVAVIEVFSSKGRLEKTSYVNVPKGTRRKYIGLPVTADDKDHFVEVTFVNNTNEMKNYGKAYYNDSNEFRAEKVHLYEGDFAYTVVNGNAEILGYEGTKTDLVIPDNISGFTVTGVGDYAFAGNKEITSVSLPNSLIYIGAAAFADTSIKEITIPENVTKMGNFAFDCCLELAKITVDERNNSFCVADGTLYSKDMIELIRYDLTREGTEFVIPDTVVTVGAGAFSDSLLTSVILPKSLKTIGENAFSWSLIESVTIPDSVESIESGAFASCSHLTEINVEGSSLNYSSENGILFSKDKTDIICYPKGKPEKIYEIPDGIETAADEAFSECSLQTIILPKSLQSVGENAFAGVNGSMQIMYKGTEEEFDDIIFAVGNDNIKYSGKIVFGYNGECTNIGTVKCWYDANKINALIDFDYLLKDACLIWAVYDKDSKLIKTEKTDVFAGTNSISLDSDADEEYTNYTSKIMIWDSLNNPKPLCSSIETGISSYVYASAVLESSHPYSNNADETKQYTYDGICESIDVTFSSDTETESGYDYIYIYDANDNQIGKYSGTSLAGKTISVPGNTVKIRLTSDGSQTRYGYKTESIVINK